MIKQFFKGCFAVVCLVALAGLLYAQDTVAASSSSGGGYTNELPKVDDPNGGGATNELPKVNDPNGGGATNELPKVNDPMPKVTDPIILPRPPLPIIPGPDGLNAKEWQEKIDQMMVNRKFDAAIDESANFLSWLGSIKNEKVANSYKLLALETKGKAHENVGEYKLASACYQKAWEINKADKWTYSRVEAEKKFEKRGEFYKLQKDFYQSQEKLSGALVKNALERKTLLAQFHQQHAKKEPTPQEMAKLRDDLKKLNDEKTKVLGELKSNREGLTAAATPFHQAQIVLNHDQREQMLAHSQKIDKDLARFHEVQKECQTQLVQIVDKYHMAWNGLKEVFGSMEKVQTKLLNLQKEFLALAAKKPLSETDKEKLRNMKTEIDGLNRQMDNLMEDMEKTFMNANAFNKLTGDQRKTFLDMLVKFKDTENTIDHQNTKVEKAFAEIKADWMYGDANRDGVVNQTDLDVLEGLVAQFPVRKGEAGYRPVLDLDGDGVLTMTDVNLMTQCVTGSRKVFPADPKCLPGDMNGDGVVSEADARSMAWYLARNLNPKSKISHVADLDGDGKFTYKDIVAMAQKLGKPDDTVSNGSLDVNKDGHVDEKDLVKLMELSTLGMEMVEPDIRKRADMDKDGKITIKDVLYLARQADKFEQAPSPVERPGDVEPISIGIATGSAAEIGSGTTGNTGSKDQPTSSDIMDR